MERISPLLVVLIDKRKNCISWHIIERLVLVLFVAPKIRECCYKGTEVILWYELSKVGVLLQLSTPLSTLRAPTIKRVMHSFN